MPHTVIQYTRSRPILTQMELSLSPGRKPTNLTYEIVNGNWTGSQHIILAHCMQELRKFVQPYYPTKIGFEWIPHFDTDTYVRTRHKTKQEVVHGALLSVLHMKLANQAIQKTILDDHNCDVIIQIDQYAPWHFSTTTPAPPTMIDFCSVILRELLHCVWHNDQPDILLTGQSPQGAKLSDHPVHSRWFQFLALQHEEESSFTALKTLINDESALYQAITSQNIVFLSEKQGLLGYVYSPATYTSQTSLYHFRPGSNEKDLSILYPFINFGEGFRTYSPDVEKITRAMFNMQDDGAPTPTTGRTP